MRTARQAHGSNRRRPARVSCPSAGQGLLAARHARAHRPGLHTLVIALRVEQIRADVVSVSDLKPVALRRIAEHNLVFTRSDGRPLVPPQDWGEFKELLEETGIDDRRLYDGGPTPPTRS